MARIDPQYVRSHLKVYFVMGSINCTTHPSDVLREAIKGGITLFQYREKGSDSLQGQRKYELGKQLRAMCKENDIPFIVNDDIELALALDADGVHIGQKDESADTVRRKIGDKILGVSVHTQNEAVEAIKHGADYLGIGPIFATRTKDDAGSAEGSTLMEELRKQGLAIPIVGIGGITAANARVVMEAGADGVAVITAITNADSIPETTMQLKQTVEIRK